MEQEILKTWDIPGAEFPYPSKFVRIAISKDKQWWTAWAFISTSKGINLGEGEIRDWQCPIDEKHGDGEWETVRQYIVKKLLPTLEPLPPSYNELDRFTDLET